MPRKPSLPPEMGKPEGLSDGRERREVLVSDFDGEVIPQAEQPARRVPTSAELRAKAKLAEIAKAKALLAMIEAKTKPKPRLVPPRKPGMRPIATLNGNAMYVPNPKWRRDI